MLGVETLFVCWLLVEVMVEGRGYSRNNGSVW